jgi:hypothetical protein
MKDINYLNRDNVISIGRRVSGGGYAEDNVENLGCISLRIPELAIAFGDAAARHAGVGNVFVVVLPHLLEFDAPCVWESNPVNDYFTPWEEARVAIQEILFHDQRAEKD